MSQFQGCKNDVTGVLVTSLPPSIVGGSFGGTEKRNKEMEMLMQLDDDHLSLSSTQS